MVWIEHSIPFVFDNSYKNRFCVWEKEKEYFVVDNVARKLGSKVWSTMSWLPTT